MVPTPAFYQEPSFMFLRTISGDKKKKLHAAALYHLIFLVSRFRRTPEMHILDVYLV